MSKDSEAVSVFLVREGKTWLSVRSQTEKGFPGHFQNPGGKKEASESSLFAAVREVREETGLDIGVHRMQFVQRVKLPTYWVNTFYAVISFIEAGNIKCVEPDKNSMWLPYYFHALNRLEPCVPQLKEGARLVIEDMQNRHII